MTDEGVPQDVTDEVDDRPASDWDEQDLLTIDEASERLAGELAELKRRIEAEGDAETRARLEVRRGQLEASLASIQSGPTELARI
jgi:hypothetical protein